jgi:ABC-type proline/glycine betaine transport system substrate-binding protein
VDKALKDYGYEVNDDNRCDYLMCPEGIVDQSLYAFGEGFRKGCEKYMYMVEYNDLVNDPEGTLRGVYKFLEIPEYKHDYKNVSNKYREKDNEVYGLGDMHQVHKEVKKTCLRPEEVLSDYVLNKYSNMEFWRKEKPKPKIQLFSL